MNENSHLYRKVNLERLLRVWDKTPTLTFADLIWKATGSKNPQTLTNEEVIKLCVEYIPVYKEDNSFKNRIKRGFKSCVTRMIIW
jgi:hypothetical protein